MDVTITFRLGHWFVVTGLFIVGPEGEIHGNRELRAMPGYNELADPRAVGTEREETRWNR